jgi:hypothetical protein
MLRPYVYLACEKVIMGTDGVASLIALFSKINVVIAAGVEIPANAAAPKEWAVFSQWDPEPGDEHREYFLCMELLYPDKSRFSEIQRTKVPVERNKRSQVIMQVNGFPIGQSGEYTVRSWIEEKQQRVFGPLEFGLGLDIVRQEVAQTPISPVNTLTPSP